MESSHGMIIHGVFQPVLVTDLNRYIKNSIQKRLENSIDQAIDRGFRITNKEFLTNSECCPFGACFVVERNLQARSGEVAVQDVNAYSVTRLLRLPLHVVDAFLDGFDFSRSMQANDFRRYRLDTQACYSALNLGCRLKRRYIGAQRYKT